MTPQEFKAWFDGFTEDMDDRPSAKQWKRIKERVAEIDGTPVTYYRYVDYYRPYWGAPYWTYCTSNLGGESGTITMTGGGGHTSNVSGGMQLGRSSLQQAHGFNSTTAMYALGKADSASLTQ